MNVFTNKRTLTK